VATGLLQQLRPKTNLVSCQLNLVRGKPRLVTFLGIGVLCSLVITLSLEGVNGWAVLRTTKSLGPLLCSNSGWKSGISLWRLSPKSGSSRLRPKSIMPSRCLTASYTTHSRGTLVPQYRGTRVSLVVFTECGSLGPLGDLGKSPSFYTLGSCKSLNGTQIGSPGLVRIVASRFLIPAPGIKGVNSLLGKRTRAVAPPSRITGNV
jgi:hypothetical protein